MKKIVNHFLPHTDNGLTNPKKEILSLIDKVRFPQETNMEKK